MDFSAGEKYFIRAFALALIGDAILLGEVASLSFYHSSIVTELVIIAAALIGASINQFAKFSKELRKLINHSSTKFEDYRTHN
jgi:hypothetical protein